MRTFLDRLWPERLRRRAELTPAARLQLWTDVGDADRVLRAVHDLLGDLLEANAKAALSPDLPADKVELARLRAGIALEIMQQIERERHMAAAQAKGDT